ncbi:BREX-3 system phosphatase PglZ [Oceanobacillus aidingensis]|uniref:BREX-3 system phosphatase PglZ n=1 Tax=Oceanobacillus aidingensis TaxID=645964 RepID=A0ABV9JST7_9BACI
MLGWRKQIIEKIQFQQAYLILVFDKDNLLNDEFVLKELQSKDFDTIRFDDSITFRYLYEQQYRTNKSERKLVIYVNKDVVFPYEFQRKALSVKVSLQTLFPKFSVNIIRQIDRGDFDALYTVHQQYQGTSSERETLEYVIKYVYKIPYEMIDDEADLYKVLLSIHYQSRQLPNILQKFLFEKWRGIPDFKDLPLKKMIESQTFFYHFLEQKWDNFVKQYLQVREEQINDPSDIYESDPLANHDVRRLMNDLFLEGQLSKIKDVLIPDAMPDWIRMGIEEDHNQEKVDKQLNYLHDKILDCLSSVTQYKDWFHINELITELKLVSMQSDSNSSVAEVEEKLRVVNNHFARWMVNQYHTLTSLPPYPKPKLVHHIPHVISNERKGNEKVALLVLDGMNFHQWKVVQRFLKEKGFLFEEQQVYAWVPTLTSVSRQAIFSGNVPLTFNKTIQTTAAEERLWRSFWENQGILKQYVTYQKGLGNEKYNRETIKALSKKSTKVYGAVIDVIDQFTHHAVLGEKSIYSNLTLWLETNYLVNFLSDLINAGYSVYLTSDHGNTNATGIGRVSEGVLVEQKGERVRIYDDIMLYEDAASKLSVKKWPNIGLPENYHVLLAEFGQAFVPRDISIVTHGGISLEEVIVPFVKVQKNKGSGLGE